MTRVAVVGATGLVGRAMLATLAKRAFPASEVVALASPRSQGAQVAFGTTTLEVGVAETFAFANTDIALFSAGAATARALAPRAAAEGALVIDNSSAWRMDADVPLIVPEVNPEASQGRPKKGIIANPNCSTAQLVMALKPLDTLATLERVVVATYQSASGAGQAALDALDAANHSGTRDAQGLAGNLKPHIDVFMDDGATKEEWKIAAETAKILGRALPLVAMCVRVPVRVSHAEAVFCAFARTIDLAEARAALHAFPGIRVVDAREEGGYATPLMAQGQDAVFVSRLRHDPSIADGRGLAMWVVADNLRKGAALNAVQIAELACAKGWVAPHHAASAT